MSKAKRAWLVNLPASHSAILYCSTACAEEDGQDFAVAPARRITQAEYESRREEFGAVCPMCGSGYEEF